MTTGEYLEIDGRPALRFVRLHTHPVERVWSLLSRPDGLATWFPAGVSFDALRVGAPVTFTFERPGDAGTGAVLAADPPHLLTLTWGGDELRFVLEPLDDGGTRLTFTVVLDRRDTAARTGAGWEVCLDAMAAHLDGAPGDGPETSATPTWHGHYDAYVAAGVPSGAPVPG